MGFARSLDHISDIVDDLDRPFSAPSASKPSANNAVTAKLTTSAGITVTYTAPALPPLPRAESSASIPLTWSTIEEEPSNGEEGCSDNNSESSEENTPYQSFMAPYGQVILDPDLDFEPQILTEEPSPDYDVIYDSKGEIIKQHNDDDDYPSSWDDEDDLVQKLDLERMNIKKSTEEPWSDIGQSVNSSFEFWKTKNKLKAVTKPKLFDTKYQHNNKYASDSNIQDAVDMTEPGLRKIPKVSIYSTTTSSEMTSTNPPSNEEHIYCSIQEGDNIYETVEVPESGFFSYVSTCTKSPLQAVTCIPVNQSPNSNSSEYEDLCSKVTVNGKLWINPQHNQDNITSTNISPDFKTNSVLNPKTLFLIVFLSLVSHFPSIFSTETMHSYIFTCLYRSGNPNSYVYNNNYNKDFQGFLEIFLQFLKFKDP